MLRASMSLSCCQDQALHRLIETRMLRRWMVRILHPLTAYWNGMTMFVNHGDRVVRVGISGSYGGLNLGDEAILQVIISELRRSVPVEVTVFSHNPEDTLSRHRVERAVSFDKLTEELRTEIDRLDFLILGGGGILFDSYAGIHLRAAVLAKEMNRPVMV